MTSAGLHCADDGGSEKLTLPEELLDRHGQCVTGLTDGERTILAEIGPLLPVELQSIGLLVELAAPEVSKRMTPVWST